MRCERKRHEMRSEVGGGEASGLTADGCRTSTGSKGTCQCCWLTPSASVQSPPLSLLRLSPPFLHLALSACCRHCVELVRRLLTRLAGVLLPPSARGEEALR